MSADLQRDDDTQESKSLPPVRGAVTVLVVLAILYPLSLGPVCWTMARLGAGGAPPRLSNAVSRFYSPLAPWIIHGPPVVQRPMRWWIGVGMRPPTVYHRLPDGIVWSNPGYSDTLWHY